MPVFRLCRKAWPPGGGGQWPIALVGQLLPVFPTAGTVEPSNQDFVRTKLVHGLLFADEYNR